MSYSISKSEYLSRIKNLQKKLVENDLDAYIVHGTSCTYENLRYLTYHWPLFEVGGAIIPQEGEAILLIGAEAPGFASESALGDNFCIMKEYGHTFDIAWEGVHYTTFSELFDRISNGRGIKRIGMGDYSTTPIGVYNSIKSALLPGGEIIRAEDLMYDLRMNKSVDEIRIIKQANIINEQIFDEFLGQVKPEMTEYECQGLLISGMYKHGGEGESFPTLLYAGERTKNMIGRSQHVPVGRNRLINIDFGTMLGGYSSAYCRPIYFGKMPEKMKDEIKFMTELHHKVLYDWVKPGVVLGDVYNKYREYFISHGYGAPPAGASHGIGIFENEPPGMRKGVKTVCKPNMVFAGDHFFRSEHWGFRIEDCYSVTETGTDVFTNKHYDFLEL